ncbi:MAG: aminoglycoside phosphotransferase family protein [Bacteroidales bacterium]|nr:aminoglycoside phosphotransferase family protein [Bacteroidales bacterium]
MESKLKYVGEQFDLKGNIKNIKPLGEGFINDTYVIKNSDSESPDYILQRKNKNIFVNIPAMMENIHKVTTHLKKKIIANGGDPERETLTLVPAKTGTLYFLDETGEYWAVSVFIKDTLDYQRADTPELAFKGGKGIGKFQAMLSDFDEPLTDILPGFHNIRYRFKQWKETLAKDPVGRKAATLKEIDWIEERREEMTDFWKLIENGDIPARITHNDTKINNILFDKNGDVLCVIDLDTVLCSSCLNDYGDAMRSYTNTGLEDDKNLDNVAMDLDIFRAYTQGYLSETVKFLNERELEYLAFSAKYITYEQVLRFLMDYIDGDHYYKIKNEQHNLIRARAQYKLLQSMEEQYETMKNIVAEEVRKHKNI